MGIGDQSPEVIEARRERPRSTDVHAPQSRFADLSGVRLHYLVAGQGDPVVLLHGYTQTSHMWRPLMAALANTHTVIAPTSAVSGNRPRRPMATPKRPWRRTSTRSSAALGTNAFGWPGMILG